MADPQTPPERGTQKRTAWNDRVRAGKVMTWVPGARPRRKKNPNPVCQAPVIHGPHDNFSDSFGRARKRHLGQGEAKAVAFSLSLAVAEDVKLAGWLSNQLQTLAIFRTPHGIRVRTLFQQLLAIDALARGYLSWYEKLDARFSNSRPALEHKKRVQNHYCTVDAGLDSKLKADITASNGLLGRLLEMWDAHDKELKRRLEEAATHHARMKRLGAQPPSGLEPTPSRQKKLRDAVATRRAALLKARTELKRRLFINWTRQGWKNRGGHGYRE